ncbi:nucleoside/nucleotide kinase family protein [Actinotalea sp. M2MS4P-6]|uniref:nucleoside/nucleotide kinase family protein n=1 Tax=Actinotalea sp. M2MS4P-6 TaxID=2983762 RepID=UPI0021E3D2C2|nr:nucleoside/nucleotide kinase family protein [Actinotalea sp. M2MS4P-6]MCV2393257.1 nucleoside/nucleotide kinase family protein [Actinotalea sp. M2MS4P-6]
MITVDPALVARLESLMARHRRVLLGITGAPGAGKSTLAEAIVDLVDPDRRTAAWVPMDGYHLADVELDRLGRRARKGAIDTFDGHGYVSLLRRIAQETTTTVYAPAFDRSIEQPIAGSIPVLPQARLVVTEGNYLLDTEEPWGEVRSALTEVWFCDVAAEVRQERLVARHVEFGKAPDAARAWVTDVDEANARRIIEARDRAACVVVDGSLTAALT